METPPTPRPAQPIEEVEIPSGAISIDLDLNPDLEGYDDNDVNELETNKASSTSTTMQNVNGDDIPYVSSKNLDISSWTLPFEDAFQTLKNQFDEGAKHESISLAQQSKFINYVDTELLQIQRKFIKNQSDSVVTYTPDQLLQDLSPILDLLWFSLLDHESLFGQEEYYIRIMGDLDDWFTYYTIPILGSAESESTNFHVRFFNFFQKLDTQISFLVDGYDAKGRFSKMSATELVRLSPIVMRLRLTIIEKFDPSRQSLNSKRGTHNDNELLNILDIEIGRLFEGILDRL